VHRVDRTGDVMSQPVGHDLKVILEWVSATASTKARLIHVSNVSIRSAIIAAGSDA
jgi:hypothetical protein